VKAQAAPENAVQRAPAEQQFASELAALAKGDKRERPTNWKLSPWAVLTYLMGGKAEDGTAITAKYVGQRRLMEIAVATLATDRALLLLGLPGTAKSWVSEHLAAAISGDSTLLVQGTAGTAEESIRYSWNYALLLSKGPSRAALVASPMMRAMESGALGPARGTHARAGRCAGHADFAAVRKNAAHPRARAGSARRAWLQPDRYRQQQGPGRERDVERAQAAFQHRHPAHARLAR
jgi:hypothetical protein